MTTAEDYHDAGRVIIWTVQPADFDISLPGQGYDHTKGYYWNDINHRRRHRYREILPKLYRHFDVSVVMWCTSRLVGWQMFEHKDVIAWEVELPPANIIAHLETARWSAAVDETEGTPLSIASVCLTPKYPIPDKRDILVRWPLTEDCRLTRLASMKRRGEVTAELLKDWRRRPMG